MYYYVETFSKFVNSDFWKFDIRDKTTDWYKRKYGLFYNPENVSFKDYSRFYRYKVSFKKIKSA